MTIRLDGGAPRACEYIGDSVTKTGHLFVEIEDTRALSVIAAEFEGVQRIDAHQRGMADVETEPEQFFAGDGVEFVDIANGLVGIGAHCAHDLAAMHAKHVFQAGRYTVLPQFRQKRHVHFFVNAPFFFRVQLFVVRLEGRMHNQVFAAKVSAKHDGLFQCVQRIGIRGGVPDVAGKRRMCLVYVYAVFLNGSLPGRQFCLHFCIGQIKETGIHVVFDVRV